MGNMPKFIFVGLAIDIRCLATKNYVRISWINLHKICIHKTSFFYIFLALSPASVIRRDWGDFLKLAKKKKKKTIERATFMSMPIDNNSKIIEIDKKYFEDMSKCHVNPVREWRIIDPNSWTGFWSHLSPSIYVCKNKKKLREPQQSVRYRK